MSVKIPVKDDPNQIIKITLDGTIFNLKLLHNSVTDSWTMGIFDENLNPILIGLRILPNTFNLRDFVNAGLPPGDFVCNADISIQNITRNSFASNEAELFYITEAEIEAI